MGCGGTTDCDLTPREARRGRGHGLLECGISPNVRFLLTLLLARWFEHIYRMIDFCRHNIGRRHLAVNSDPAKRSASWQKRKPVTRTQRLGLAQLTLDLPNLISSIFSGRPGLSPCAWLAAGGRGAQESKVSARGGAGVLSLPTAVLLLIH